MAEIVLGVGTSHSPLLTFDAAMWLERAGDDLRNPALTLSDGRTVDYASLLAERGPMYAAQCRKDHLDAQVLRVEAAIARIADCIEAAALDIVLVVGDDQEELYKAGNTPSLAVYYGDEIVMRPLGEMMTDPPAWMRQAVGGYAMDTAHTFPGAPEFAEALILKLMDAGVDLAVHSTIDDPRKAAFGHAYGFVAHRLFGGRRIPIVPILLNTYYPPNVIRPGRCYEIGERIAEAVRQIGGNKRVGIVASGGLSHFVTDADLDGAVLDALRVGDADTLRKLPMDALRAGSSEILCWVMAGGAFAHLEHQWSDYTPVYRTEAGTGIGLAFGIWGEAA